MPGDLSHVYWHRQLHHVAEPLKGGTPSGPSDEVARLQQEVENLKRALETREVIGMAKGILMAKERCHPDAAFDMLRRASQRENRKLVELAAQIVEQNARKTGRPHY